MTYRINADRSKAHNHLTGTQGTISQLRAQLDRLGLETFASADEDMPVLAYLTVEDAAKDLDGSRAPVIIERA